MVMPNDVEFFRLQNQNLQTASNSVFIAGNMVGQPECVGGLTILIFDYIVTITFGQRGPR